MTRLASAGINLAILISMATVPSVSANAAQFGFAKVDVTPSQPVRLSGYGNRAKPHEGIDEPLFVRIFAQKHGSSPVHVLASVDSLGMPGALTIEIQKRLERQFHITRPHFVLCATHTHTAPFLLENAPNLFATPLTMEERKRAKQYAQILADAVVQAVEIAINDLKPGKMFTASGKATFATNRRVLKDGRCVGMAPNPHGAVDHSLPFLKITDPSGEQIRGIVFNYACHCTTFDGDYNRINGDWAGYATQYLESENEGAIALCTIGCGADANPRREREHAFEIAQAQGREIATEIERLAKKEMTEISASPRATFGFAGLPIDRPSLTDLKKNLGARQPQVRRHAQNMLATHKKMGRLPETYPMPIQVWRFGSEFTMFFLGGEVCVDYAHRIGREFNEGPTWVTAYANDVFGYVASERMRDEGGYEVDFSMIFYNQPGRWSTGTEEVIFRRIHELYQPAASVGSLSVEEALATFSVPEGFTIDVVAEEPLITDSVNFSVAPDG